MNPRIAPLGWLLAGLLASAGALAGGAPGFVVRGSVSVTEYDAVSLRDGYPDDLLSGGLNAAGLQGAAPAFADPTAPTDSEVRRLAIYTNFRAITDMTDAGGYGLFWGPGLAPRFDGVEPGLIPGVEYRALMRPPAGSRNINRVPVVVQIPRHFDVDEPCILLVPPSGSRGPYGGVAIGEWGLFQGCAVALPGKGTGTGFHLLGSDEVFDVDGQLRPADEADRHSQFTVRDSRQLRDFVESSPDRIATKHAHSEINPERLWGDLALQGVEFALWALNDAHPGKGKARFSAGNTLVVASGTSNAAGTTLRAIENDRRNLIDGAAVIEPNINPDSAGRFAIRYRDSDFTGHGTSLYDNHSLMAIYAPCAALSPSLAGTPFNFDPIGALPGARATRCQALSDQGLVEGSTLEEQAQSALAVLRQHGYYEEQDTMLASHEWLNLWRSLNPTYAAAHGRFAVWENVCGVSFAATDAEGRPTPLPEAAAAALFAVSGGIPATGGVNLVDDHASQGPVAENLSISPDTGLADLNLDGARCFRYLATGDPRWLDDGHASAGDRQRRRRVARGIARTRTSADLGGTPTLMLTGRDDGLVFPNYHSRPYFGLNQLVEGKRSRLSYIEVANAQHFEAFISSLWLDPATGAVQFVPLHYYLFQALDWMKAYLEGERDALPPSQVLRPVPRGLEAYAAEDAGGKLLPDIAADPGEDSRITFSDRVLHIPQ